MSEAEANTKKAQAGPPSPSAQFASLGTTLSLTIVTFLLCYVVWKQSATLFRGTFLWEFRFVSRFALILLVLVALNPIYTRLQKPLESGIGRLINRLSTAKTSNGLDTSN